MTKRITTRIVLIFAITIGIPSIASADLLSITDGTGNFQWNPDDGTSLVSASFDPNYAPAFSPILRFRRPLISGTGAGQLATVDMGDLSDGVNFVTSSANSAGATGTAHSDVQWLRNLLTVEDLFDVDFAFTVSSNALGDTVLDWSMTVTNTYSGTLNDIQAFHYWDWDLINNQNSGEDFSLGGFQGFLQRVDPLQGNPANQNAFLGTDNFENWEVDDWDNIETKLFAGGNLSNSGTPYAVADMTAALGWDIGTLASGESFTVNMHINSVPEPNMAQVFSCVSVLLIGLCLYRKRR